MWALYAHAIARAGRAIPTLIEWDSDVPPFAVLAGEAGRANAVMAGALSAQPGATAAPTPTPARRLADAR